ncbi:hypothetical protein CN333_00045 [Bacillus thuringiensis]|uniref:hypothetical protein n=1 Tax=Bacillus thuringiensis TaxID=1428 RepID=UPI000BF51EDE|nr:hypothetical protein [Bacillus thuringiensis]PFE80023.1 hypothetical protein CN333_00045 [Bacillus thuringiensis]
MSKVGVAKTQEYRRPRKRKRIVLEERVIDGEVVVGKECTKCGEWKPLDDGFNKEKSCLGGKRSRCKKCQAIANRQWCEENREKRLRYYSKYREKNRKIILERNRKYREENKEKRSMYFSKWYEENKEKRSKYYSKWQQDNPNKVALSRNRRRARKKALPDDFTIEQANDVLAHFEDGCSLTRDTDIHWDHVIPLTTGHGGTIFGNMIPLRSDLNESKNGSNIFEWFEANRQRFELSQAKFDRLIAWLAAVNEMTAEEYRDYVYWCHANPNDVLESEAI